MRWLHASLTVLAASGLAVAAIPALAATGPTVVTQNGAVSGVANGSMKEWRGIPYAAPPIGNLRWRPPAPAASWHGLRDATTFASPCVQPSAFAADGSVTATTGSEDCLYLNVFAPAGATASSRLAVMVHLHGGGNTFGAPYEDASAFVSRGVVVVTLAYRLGVFGFAGHPALTVEGGGSSGEYGVLDQLAALRWVHDNIAAFGGDPTNVTLFGLSAGSFDTVALTASPLTSGLITRAAVQGEAFWAGTGTSATIGDAEQIGLQVVGTVGCAAAADVLACLRALPADVLVRAAGALDVPPWVGGVVLPKSPLALISQRLQGIPLLIGFDREEQAGLAWPFLANPFTTHNWIHTTNLLVGPPLGAQARALYPGDQYESLKWAYITMETDAVRGCTTRRLANANVAHAPVYRYLYTHAYENDPFLAQFKSSHAFEDPFLWGNFNLFPGFIFGYQPSRGEQLLSQRMSDYWTNFAKTGDPNSSRLPVWPRYNATTEPILTLDDQIGVTSSYHVAQCALLATSPPFSFAAFSHGRKKGLFDFLP